MHVKFLEEEKLKDLSRACYFLVKEMQGKDLLCASYKKHMYELFLFLLWKKINK